MADTPTPAAALREEAIDRAIIYSKARNANLFALVEWNELIIAIKALAALAEQATPVAVEAVQQPDLLKLFNEIMESIDTHRGIPVWDHARMYQLRAALSAPAAPTVPVAPAEPVEGVFVTQQDIDAAREAILECTATDLLSGNLSAKRADRAWVYRKLCAAAGRLIGTVALNSSETPNGSPALNSLKRIDSPAGKPDLHQWTGSEWVPVGWSVEAMEQRAKALEFAEYVAKRSEQLLASLNTLHAAEGHLEHGEHDEASLTLASIAADTAQQAVSDHWRYLESSIYEFRKRAARAGKEA